MSESKLPVGLHDGADLQKGQTYTSDTLKFLFLFIET